MQKEELEVSLAGTATVLRTCSLLQWRHRVTLEVIIVLHSNCSTIEVIAYHPEFQRESRLYLDESLLRKICSSSVPDFQKKCEDFIESKEKPSLMPNGGDPLQRILAERFVLRDNICTFIASRIYIYNESRDHFEVELRVNFGDPFHLQESQMEDESGDSSSSRQVLDVMLPAIPAELTPFHTMHSRRISSIEIHSVLKSMEADRAAIVACTRKASTMLLHGDVIAHEHGLSDITSSLIPSSVGPTENLSTDQMAHHLCAGTLQKFVSGELDNTRKRTSCFFSDTASSKFRRSSLAHNTLQSLPISVSVSTPSSRRSSFVGNPVNSSKSSKPVLETLCNRTLDVASAPVSPRQSDSVGSACRTPKDLSAEKSIKVQMRRRSLVMNAGSGYSSRTLTPLPSRPVQAKLTEEVGSAKVSSETACTGISDVKSDPLDLKQTPPKAGEGVKDSLMATKNASDKCSNAAFLTPIASTNATNLRRRSSMLNNNIVQSKIKNSNESKRRLSSSVGLLKPLLKSRITSKQSADLDTDSESQPSLCTAKSMNTNILEEAIRRVSKLLDDFVPSGVLESKASNHGSESNEFKNGSPMNLTKGHVTETDKHPQRSCPTHTHPDSDTHSESNTDTSSDDTDTSDDDDDDGSTHDGDNQGGNNNVPSGKPTSILDNLFLASMLHPALGYKIADSGSHQHTRSIIHEVKGDDDTNSPTQEEASFGMFLDDFLGKQGAVVFGVRSDQTDCVLRPDTPHAVNQSHPFLCKK